MSEFKLLILDYLGLPNTYEPSPCTAAIQFLTIHLRQLPPHLLTEFSHVTTPKQRTAITAIRNRRLRYTDTNPPEFGFTAAKSLWPALWHGRERRGKEEGIEEKQWVETEFLQGSTKHVGQLGALLGGYEEEREAERVRILRRESEREASFVPEEDSDSDDEEVRVDTATEEETMEDATRSFERLVKERFIYGLLEGITYDIDWDDKFDVDDDREAQERWFDEDEDGSAIIGT